MTEANVELESIPKDILASLGDRYVDIKYLSSGANGAVFRAHDQDLDKQVAIKVLKSSTDRDLISFQKEARAAAQLEHKNLVSILNFGITTNNNAYIILDFIDGLSLERLIANNGRLSIELSLELLQQIAQGLAHAHSKNISHRDLKTSNIMVHGFGSSSLKVVIIDFGLAYDQKLQDESQLASATLFGSPLYMSPEQASGARGDKRSDIYSLGCIAYRMISGSPPFQTDDLFTLLKMHRENQPAKLSELIPEVKIPEGLQECLDGMLKKDPDQRTQSIQEISDRLKSIEQDIKKDAEELLAKEKESRMAPQAVLNAHGKSVRKIKKAWLAIPAIVGVTVCTSFVLVILFMHFFAPKAELHDGPVKKTAIESRGVQNSEKFVNIWKVEKAEIFDEQWREQILPRESIDDSSLELLATEKTLKSTNLNLTNTTINGTGLKFLKDLSIRSIDLTGTNLSAEGWEELSKLKQIEELNLSKTNMGEPELRLIARLPKLKALFLGGCKNVDDKCARVVSSIQSLMYLNLSETAVTDSGLEYIADMENLYGIALTKDEITDAGVLKLLKLKNLSDFKADHCSELTGKSLKAIAGKYSAKIGKISMNFTKVKKEDLDCLKNCSVLSYLSLSGIPMTDRELKLIAGLKNLMSVYFSESNFSDEVFKETIAGWPRIETVGAISCNIKPETIQEVTKRKKNPVTGKYKAVSVVTGSGREGLPEHAQATIDMILSEDEIGTLRESPSRPTTSSTTQNE